MKPRTAVLLLVVATVASMGVVCTFGFTNAEDQGLIIDNPNLNPPTAHGLWEHWQRPHVYLYIPVTYTAWWVLALLGRTSTPDENGALLNPWLFHSANLLLHIGTSIIIFHLLRKLTRRDGPSLVGAMVFALHPIQVEAVAWTTGTKDVLCGFFSFAALLLYVHHAPTNRLQPRVLGTIALVLALLSKPAACVVPVLAALIDFFVLDRPAKQVARSVWPWVVLAVPILLIARLVQPASDVIPTALWTRPLIAGDALAFYLSKIFWPVGLTVDYSRPPRVIIAGGAIYWTWVIPVVVTIVILVTRQRRLVAAWLIFVAGLLPVLGLTVFMFQYFSTVADRFVYLSMFGIALGVTSVVSLKWTRPVIATCAVVLLVLGVMSSVQARTWRDRRSLYTHAVAVSPYAATAHSNLASVYMREGNYEQAEHLLRQSIALDPQFPLARQNLAVVLQKLGKSNTPATTSSSQPSP